MNIETAEMDFCPICEEEIAIVRGISPMESLCPACGVTLIIPAMDDDSEISYKDEMFFRIF